MPWVNGEVALAKNQCGFTQSPVRQLPQRFFKKPRSVSPFFLIAILALSLPPFFASIP